MKREIAEQVIGAMHGVDLAIDRLDLAVQAIEDEAERKRMLKSIFSVVSDLQEQVTLPVVRRYPDLHPDRSR
jgi:hypothetical protein